MGLFRHNMQYAICRYTARVLEDRDAICCGKVSRLPYHHTLRTTKVPTSTMHMPAQIIHLAGYRTQ